MRLRNPKSLIACALVLILPIKDMLLGPHISVFYYFELIMSPVAAVYCFWHAFKGRRALLGRSELHTSLMLAVLSLGLAVGLTFTWPRYHYRAAEISVAILFSAAAVFFFCAAFREQHLTTTQDQS
jgi:hypothetical protein